MNDCIKLKTEQKSLSLSNMVRTARLHMIYQNFQFAIPELSDYITERKTEYNFQLSQSFNNPGTSSKTYWTILKTFYSGKKIPLIPLLVINNQLITDFREKANYFNLYFAKQCTPIENDSSIPTETNRLCDATISVVNFEDKDVLKIINTYDKNLWF